MTVIRVNCPTCGDVELEGGDVVRLEASFAPWTVFGAELKVVDGYRFDCPGCGRTYVEAVSPPVAAALAAAGCVVAPGGPITEEEIQVFVERMGNLYGERMGP